MSDNEFAACFENQIYFKVLESNSAQKRYYVYDFIMMNTVTLTYSKLSEIGNKSGIGIKSVSK